MEISEDIINLINTVFSKEMTRFHVNDQDIRTAIRHMKEAYMPDSNWMYGHSPKGIDYNDAAHRCAYLHKYAMLHTGLVYEYLQLALRTYSVRNRVVSADLINLCSLGGGPGTDIVALLLALGQVSGAVWCNVRVIDSCEGWNNVFESAISELRTGHYGDICNIVSSSYFEANLLDSSSFNSYDVHESIAEADITTMIKFISAAACRRTKEMIQEIFQIMKPGSMLLFIDNAAGGFHDVMEKEARDYGLESVFGPVKHSDYEDAAFSRTLFGYTSQSKTRVTVEMWKKSLTLPSKICKPPVYYPRRRKASALQTQGEDVVDSPNIRLHNQRAAVENEVGGKCCIIM